MTRGTNARWIATRAVWRLSIALAVLWPLPAYGQESLPPSAGAPLASTGASAAGKVHFYQQETMIAPPVKLPLPFLFNLYTNPQEDESKTILDSWIIGPVLKMIGTFEESTKKYPLIPMGTPDPYRPPTGQQ